MPNKLNDLTNLSCLDYIYVIVDSVTWFTLGGGRGDTHVAELIDIC